MLNIKTKVVFYLNKEGFFPFQRDGRFLRQNQKKILDLIKTKNKSKDIEVLFLNSNAPLLEVVKKCSENGKRLILIDSCLPYFANFFKSANFLGSTLVDENKNYLFYSGSRPTNKKNFEELKLEKTLYNPHCILKFFVEILLSQIERRFISSQSTIEKGASLVGKIVVKKHVRILRGAVVKGPAIIKENAIIGNNALVRNSYLDEDCVIGYNTEIARSYIGKGSSFHTNFIGDSLIGDYCYFGFGACTSVVRLDEAPIEIRLPMRRFPSFTRKLGCFVGSDCRFGTFVNIMPGITIGKECFLSPMAFIKEPISNGSFVGQKYPILIKKSRIRMGHRYREKFRRLLDQELSKRK